MELQQAANDKSPDPSPTAVEDERQKVDELSLKIKLQIEARQNRDLLQAVIAESKASGFPMPPSLIKLLNSTNGNLCLIFINFVYCVLSEVLY